MLRRTLIATVAAGLSAPQIASAQGNWPARPVRIIVPYPPGGSNDVVARILQPRLQEVLGQSVIVENRGGASGSVGSTETARSAPDGYTWLLANDTVATNDTLLELPYKTMQAFSFCTVVGTCPYALLTQPTTPYRTMEALVAAAKAAPETLNYATTGTGSLAHISATLLQQRGDFRLVHVPYRGGGPALQDVLGGHLPLFMSNIVIVLPHVRSGALRAIGVSSARPSTYLPGVAPFAELGFPGFEALTYWALLGPAGVPAPIVQRMQTVIAGIAAEPAVRARLQEQGATVTTTSPADTEAFLRQEVEKWATVIRENNIRADS
ncbi:Bug family tripartite tricarboxylate transporter substrate binding protein [Muricoccus radiodurans]|uniref:Bug family tripartite tricarboxylate transporter substrate binding protein n=1 Tax=Muricoccus radiodurans TaxID=2231721 RepID=UPI003CF05B8D